MQGFNVVSSIGRMAEIVTGSAIASARQKVLSILG